MRQLHRSHRRVHRTAGAASILALGCASTLALGAELHAQSATTNPYRVTFGWEKLPQGRTLGIVSGVIPDPDGRHLWILDRCGANQCAGSDLDPILKFDLDGDLVDSFGAGLFAFPHGFALDHEGFLWVTDGGSHGDARATLGESMGMGHQVLKLTREGEVVMRLGEAAVWGDDETHFNGPSGVAVAPTATFGSQTGTGAGTTASSGSPVRGCSSPRSVEVSVRRAESPLDSATRTISKSTPGGGCSSRTAATAESRSSTQRVTFSTSGPTTASRAGCSSTATTSSNASDGLSGDLRTGPPTRGGAISAGRKASASEI